MAGQQFGPLPFTSAV